MTLLNLLQLDLLAVAQDTGAAVVAGCRQDALFRITGKFLAVVVQQPTGLNQDW